MSLGFCVGPPGTFKLKENWAGDVKFVAPDLVEGTLKRGYEFFPSLAPDSLERLI